MTLTSRDRRALLLGTICILPPTLAFLVVLPYARSIAQLHDGIDKTAAALRRERAVIEGEATGAGPTASLEAALDRHASRMFLTAQPAADGGEIASLSGYARLSALAAGWRLETVSTRTGESPDPAVTPVDVLVIGETDVNGLEELLAGLEYGPKLVRVRELSVESAGATAANGSEPLAIRLLLRGYMAGNGGVAEPAGAG